MKQSQSRSFSVSLAGLSYGGASQIQAAYSF